MYRVTLLVLFCVTFNAKALEVTDECCSGMTTPVYAESKPAARYVVQAPAKRRYVTYAQKPKTVELAEPEVEYVTESAPLRSTTEYEESTPTQYAEEVDRVSEAPRSAAHYEPAYASSASVAPRITIEITASPQPVTELSAPAHYEAAAADLCEQGSKCGRAALEPAYTEETEYVPVRRERVRAYHTPRAQYVRPVHAAARYTYEARPQRLQVVEEGSPARCAGVCRVSAGCCQ